MSPALGDVQVLAYIREQDKVVLRSMIAEACNPATCTQGENQLARHLDAHMHAVEVLQRYCAAAREALLDAKPGERAKVARQLLEALP